MGSLSAYALSRSYYSWAIEDYVVTMQKAADHRHRTYRRALELAESYPDDKKKTDN